MRLTNTQTGVQILVPNDKAKTLIAQGLYEPVPDADQPPPGVGERKPAKDGDDSGPTSIAEGIKRAAGPTWNHPAP